MEWFICQHFIEVNAQHRNQSDKMRQSSLSIHETTKSNTCQTINKNPNGTRKKWWMKENSVQMYGVSIEFYCCVSMFVGDFYVKITCLITVWHSSILTWQINMPKKVFFFHTSRFRLLYLFALPTISDDMLF